MLSALSAQMYLIMYLLLFISGIVLRYKKPHVQRPYKVPLKKNVGMWICCLVGIIAALFALICSFVSPSAVLKIEHVYNYGPLLISGLVISCLIPLVLYSLRKPHWKIKVLSDIREDIHKSMH